MASGRGRRRVIAGMSGAQAAAGDLLRARQKEKEVEVEVDQAQITAVTAAFVAFEAYYKACRAYQTGHPAVERFLGNLLDKLGGALAKHGDLDLVVTARGLELHGHEVATSDRAESNMWFPLYRDGIRELQVFEGIGAEELAKFGEALVRLASIDPTDALGDGEDDAVTVLWSLDLEHVIHTAIDSFLDATSPDEETRRRVERVREVVTLSMAKELPVGADAPRDVLAARGLKRVHLAHADLTAFGRENLSALDELPRQGRDALADLVAIDTANRDALRKQVDADPDIVAKTLDAIIHALFDEGRREQVEVLVTRVSQAFTALVTGGKFEQATYVRELVKTCVRHGADTSIVEQVDRVMASDAVVDAIVAALVSFEDDALDEVTALLAVMPPFAALHLLGGLARIEQRNRRRATCDIVATWGLPAIEATAVVLRDCPEEVALDLLYLLRQASSDAAGAALERATHHASAAIRSSALRLYADIAPPTGLVTRLRAALRDADELVRAVGIEIVVARRPEHAAAWIRDTLAQTGVTRSLAEKQRLFLAHAKLGGEAAATDLIARLEQRNLLGRSAIDDERIAAALALGQIRHEPARDALEKIANAMLTRGAVKAACTDALARLDAEEPAAAPEAPAQADPSPAPMARTEPAATEPPPAPMVMFRATAKSAPLEPPAADPIPEPPLRAPPTTPRPPRLPTPQSGSPPLDAPRPRVSTSPIDDAPVGDPRAPRPRVATPQSGSAPIDAPRPRVATSPIDDVPVGDPRAPRPRIATSPIQDAPAPDPRAPRSRLSTPQSGSAPLDAPRPRVSTSPIDDVPVGDPRAPRPRVATSPIQDAPALDPRAPRSRLTTPQSGSAPIDPRAPRSRPATPPPIEEAPIRDPRAPSRPVADGSEPRVPVPRSGSEPALKPEPPAEPAKPPLRDSRSASGRRAYDDGVAVIRKPPKKDNPDG